MKKTFSSFAALIKKDVCLFGRKMLSTVALLLLILLGCAVALIAIVNSQSKDEKVNLALVDHDASALSKMAISVVKGSDAVREIFAVHNLNSTEEAVQQVKDGNFSGAIIFSENYLSSILDGDSSAVRIVLSKALSASAQTIYHFAKTGEKLMRVAEYGVMSASYPLYASSKSDAYDKLNTLEAKFALKLLSMPENAFEHEKMPYANSSVGILEYYILAFSVFMLIILEVIFFPFTAKDLSQSMLRRIKSYKISNSVLVFEKSVIPFVIRVSLLFAAVAIAKEFADINLSAFSVLLALLCIFLLSVFMTSLSVLLSQSSLGIAVIFAFSSVGLFMCGGLIPISMLNTTVVTLGNWLPQGLCLKLLSPLLCGNASLYSAALLLAICVCAFALATKYINRICNREGGAL